MSDTNPDPSRSSKPAEPIVTKMRWPFPIIWIVPIIALGAAGYYLYDQHKQRGPQIQISFVSAEGLNPGETPVKSLGAIIGKVTDAKLDAKRKHVIVSVQLDGQYADLAASGTRFWMVKPEFTGGDISGISTVISGPYIEALAGTGPTTRSFDGSSKAPVMRGPGIRVILHTDRLKHLQVGTPVFFRGIEVGSVQDVRLNDTGTGVNATVFVRDRFTGLLRPTSRFWTSGGVDVKGGVLTGVDVRINSLQSLLAGGITFATPEEGTTQPAADGTDFILHDDSKDEWLKWAPRLPVPDDSTDASPIEDESPTMGHGIMAK